MRAAVVRKRYLVNLATSIKIAEQDPMTVAYLATMLFSGAGEHESAVALLRKAQREYPGDFRINTKLSVYLLQIKRQPSEAVRYASAALAIRPRNPVALLNLGSALGENGQLDAAIAAFRKAIKLEPDWAAAYYNLGYVLTMKGELDGAIAAYRTAIKLRPDDVRALNNLGTALGAQGQLDAAIAAHRTAIKRKPDDADAYFNLGNALLSIALPVMGAWDDAIAAYRTAISLEPDDADAYVHVGNALRAQGRWDEAIAAHQRALKLKPMAETALILSNTLVRAGRHQAAASLAARLAPSRITSSQLYNVACFYGLAVAAARSDSLLSLDENSKLVGEYSANAVTLLKRVAAAGFFRLARNAELLQTDPDLNSLRHGDDFRKFAESAGIVLPAYAMKPADIPGNVHTSRQQPMKTQMPLTRIRVNQILERLKVLVRDFHYVDLQDKANVKLTDSFHNREGNNLERLPQGEQILSGVKFQIDPGFIQLASERAPTFPEKATGIAVGNTAAQIHFLHGTGWGSPSAVADGTTIGAYVVHYADSTEAVIPIVYGEDVRDWWNWDGSKTCSRGRVAWRGSNPAADVFIRERIPLRLYRGTWKNPHPNKKIASIDCTSTNKTISAPFCIAISLEQPVDSKNENDDGGAG